MSELRRITERYRLDKLVVSSDAGSVFRATDNQSGDTVAIKLINSGISGDSEEPRNRFLETALALQSLQHPCIPRVLDFGFTTAGSAFLVTEYLHGSSFQEFAGSSPARVVSLLLLLVDGLEAMAQKGLACRNLRAENLLVVPGAGGEQVKILGLGSASLRLEGVTAANPDGYREDLHAFGILACRMMGLTAGPENRIEVPLGVITELEDPEALRALLEAALQGDPERLFPSYQEVRRALRLALFGQTGRKAVARTEISVPSPPPERSLRPVKAEPAPGAGLPPVPAGTVILSSPFRAAMPDPADPAPERSGEGTQVSFSSAEHTLLLSGEGNRERPEEPLSESRAGTVRMALPIEPAGVQVRPPVAPTPPFPATPSGEPISVPSGTVLIPTIPTPPPPPPARRRSGTVETPFAARDPKSSEPLPPPSPRVAPPPVPFTAEAVVHPQPAPSPSFLPEPPPAAPAAIVEERPAPSAPPAVPRGPAPQGSPARQRRKGWLLVAVGAPIAVLLLVGFSFLLFRQPSPAPPPPVTKPAPKPAPPPVVAQPEPTPVPVHPKIELAEVYLGAGDLKGVKTALDSISPEEQAAFRPDELERYQRLADALAPLKREERASALSRALDTGDLRVLRSLVSSLPAAEQAQLTPDVQRNLARARRALDADNRLARAQKAGNHLEVIRLASTLLQELPRSARAGEQRASAAGDIEAQVDAAIDAGQFDTALGHLEGLRQVWPDRAGLDARSNRIASERKSDLDQDSLLAAVARAEKANKPLEGLQLLADVKPNRRFADRFREARQRLESQVAQLDRGSPEISLRGSSQPTYEKGKTATISLRITDDGGVKDAEGWARAEGEEFVKVAVRHLSGSDYVMEVPPDVHQNETVELYVTASDQSGHSGQLGSADHPLKVKRKGFFKKLLGGKDGG